MVLTAPDDPPMTLPVICAKLRARVCGQSTGRSGLLGEPSLAKTAADYI